MIYLDNAATTPMSPAAISAMTQVMQDIYGNASSIHSHGRQAGKLLREARQDLAELLERNLNIFFSLLEVQRVTIQLLLVTASDTSTKGNILSLPLSNITRFLNQSSIL